MYSLGSFWVRVATRDTWGGGGGGGGGGEQQHHTMYSHKDMRVGGHYLAHARVNDHNSPCAMELC